MNLKSLEYFIEVANDLNITSAAQRLYISQQALSAQIQKLEQYYGVTLFERQPKMRLTYAGEQLLEGAKKIIKDSEEITNSLSDISRNHAGILRIGIPSYRAKECFPLVLPEFTKKWPNVAISLEESTTDSILALICDGNLDVGVVSPSALELQTFSDRLDFTFLLDDQTYLICSDELMKRCFGNRFEEVKKSAMQGTDLHDFKELPFMLHKPPMKLRKVADECFSIAGFKPKVFMETSNTELMIALYSCHVGGFFCRKTRLRSIRQLCEDCNAFPVKNTDTPHQMPVFFVQRKSQRPPAHVLDFQRLMKTAWKTIAES